MTEQSQELQDILRLINKLKRNWYVGAGLVFVGLLCAFVYLRYASKIYVVNSQIVSKRWEQQGGSSSFLPIPNELNKLLWKDVDIRKEIAIITHEDNLKETIKRMNIQTTYFAEGKIKRSELYPAQLYQVVLNDKNDELNGPYGLVFSIDFNEDKSFSLELDDPLNQWAPLLEKKQYQEGEEITLGAFSFKVNFIQGEFGSKQDLPNGLQFVINDLDYLADVYKERLNINWVEEGSSLLGVSIQGETPYKEMIFLSTFFEVIEESSIEKKNASLNQVLSFVDQQLFNLSDSLNRFDEAINQFALENWEYLQGDTSYLASLKDVEYSRMQLEMRNRYIDYLEAYLIEKRAEDVFAPNALGLDIPLLQELVMQYVELKLEQKAFKVKANEMNPLVNKVARQVERIELSILENIANMRREYAYQGGELDKERKKLLAGLGDQHTSAKLMSKMDRMYKLNEDISTMLMQKKMEIAIMRAGATSDYEVMVKPKISNNAISPSKKMVLGIGSFVALLLFVGIYYFNIIIETNVTIKEDVERLTGISVIGAVYKGKASRPILDDPVSAVSESIRQLRASLFMLKSNKGAHIILLSSAMPGEGKTFLASNLSWANALAGKKTLLIGADLRKPTLHRYFDIEKDSKGLSNYLTSQYAGFQDVLFSPHKELDVLPSGIIPPNPSELLMSEKMNLLIHELKDKYEVIIIDTAPIHVVSDAMSLVELVDTKVLVVRQNKTPKKILKGIRERKMDIYLDNTFLVFNDVDLKSSDTQYSYSYRYGEGYYAE
ncbi:tyrosine-protein kinase family protein [Persicobacter sp. CCB-QB2]|uniref:tyrosine-protein kinase family protein n=1 Tax=Persicobacter sp. CCB-QB2 TaxID=1561025 RepID=UPI0006A98ED9|nr:tyrosine-protein kinase family protein [Persicobacter sp. CCB-QB2]